MYCRLIKSGPESIKSMKSAEMGIPINVDYLDYDIEKKIYAYMGKPIQ